MQANPCRGYIITPLQLSQIKYLFAFRGLIEGETAALASRVARPAHFDEMAALIRSDDPAPDDEPERISRMILVNNAYHETISLASDNRRLHRSVVQIIREFERFYYVKASSPEFFDPAFVDHQAILEAIYTGDPCNARKTVSDHIESSRRVLVRAITDRTGRRPGREIWY